MSDLLNLCPIWNKACIREDCTSYSVHTKNRFKNIKTDNFIPLDQISFYLNYDPEELEKTIERHVTITRECRRLGKIIEIKNTIDHLIPNED